MKIEDIGFDKLVERHVYEALKRKEPIVNIKYQSVRKFKNTGDVILWSADLLKEITNMGFKSENVRISVDMKKSVLWFEIKLGE